MGLLKELRKRLSLSQEQMALCLGVSRTMIAHCETGRKELSGTTFLKLVEIEKLTNRIAESAKAKEAAEDQLVNDHYESSLKNPDPHLRLHGIRTAKMHRRLVAMRVKNNRLNKHQELSGKLLDLIKAEDIKGSTFLKMLDACLRERSRKVSSTKQLQLKARIMGRIREYEVLNEENQSLMMNNEL